MKNRLSLQMNIRKLQKIQ